MGVILATFLFVMITLGFALLMVLPLVFVWLMVAVYLEPSGDAALPAHALADMVRAPEQVAWRPHSTSVTGQEALTPADHFVGARG